MNNIEDKRVHLMFYFFTGHKTVDNDFKILRKLQKYVNIIPVISKADSFKGEELYLMKMDIINTA